MNASIIEELAMAFECELDHYDEVTNLLSSKIVNLSIDEKILNQEGKIDPAILRPITFDSVNNDYLVLGEKVGNAMEDGALLKGEYK